MREHSTAQHSTEQSTARAWLLQDVSIDGQLCGTISQEATVNTINCGNKLGRIVKVALKGSNDLTLCEVEVWGSTSAGTVNLAPA